MLIDRKLRNVHCSTFNSIKLFSAFTSPQIKIEKVVWPCKTNYWLPRTINNVATVYYFHSSFILAKKFAAATGRLMTNQDVTGLLMVLESFSHIAS